MKVVRMAALAVLVLGLPALDAASPDWVQRSNTNAAILLRNLAKYSPEMASRLGVDGQDTSVTSLPADRDDRMLADTSAAIAELELALSAERDLRVRQDLQILTNSAHLHMEETRLERRYRLPYFDVPLIVFEGLRALLDEQSSPQRRLNALVRLRKYAGLVPGTAPLTRQAMAYTRACLGDSGLVGPFKGDLVKNMGNSARYVTGIGELFQKYNVEGYQPALEQLKEQVAEYDAFLQREVMPRASPDFRLPAELYQHALKRSGIDMPVEELVSRAKTSFRELQNEMNALAPLVAREKGIPATDYREVIRALKKEQISGDRVLPFYQGRLKEIERLISSNRVVTLPRRETLFRIATEAETAATPAPHMQPPRLIGNTGECGVFVLPLRIPSADGRQELGFDDFTFDAAAWTLSAHEARPGHELQFASIVENGVSLARALFALNSVNIEGWALYMEAEMKPYEPLDGQLIALQHRLLRASRAFLDPSLQLGRLTREEAYRILEQDVLLSRAMATQEVERYTFWAPGQAPSYFVGYARLMELHTDVEIMMGEKFDAQSYHDFILAQGLVSPAILREAVILEYVKPRMIAASAN